MAYYVMLFVAGFAGSFHCLGMCGGFACALGAGAKGRGVGVGRHLLYNAGRLTTYCFIGALAGAFGAVICTPHGTVVRVLGGALDLPERGLALVAGVLMIVMALRFFRVPSLDGFVTGWGSGALASALRTLLTARGGAAPLAFGVFNGFLPCPLVYALTADAASTAGPLTGMLTMASFGLGTLPAMLAMGLLGRMLAPAWRQRGVRLAGAFVLLVGLITLSRAILPSAMLGAHAAAPGHPV
jgi:uncharacterized protein